MRKAEDIKKDGTRLEILQLEVLLDIRELLRNKKPVGRPRKSKKEA